VTLQVDHADDAGAHRIDECAESHGQVHLPPPAE
jgi:hypothetical protein